MNSHRNFNYLAMISAVAVFALCAPSLADSCMVEATQRIASPTGPNSTGFAAALDISGDTIIAGDETDATFGNLAGAAFVYLHIGTEWTLDQTLHAGDAATNDRFGAAVAMDGDTAVIGAWGDVNGGIAHGAAYVFQKVEGKWTQTAKLFDDSVNDPPDLAGAQNVARQFGRTVAIDGDVILIGAPQDGTLASNAGAAYTYRFDGKSWALEQKLLASNGASSNRFGNGVAVDGDRALIGATGGSSGRVYAFTFNGSAWNQQQEITLPAGGLGSVSPLIMSLDGNRAGFGLPLFGPAEAKTGAALVYQHDGASWVFAHQIIPDDADPTDLFGSAIAIKGEDMAISAKQYDVVYPLVLGIFPSINQGIVYVYRFEREQPVIQHKGYAELQLFNTQDLNLRGQLGEALAIEGDQIVVGAPNPKDQSDFSPNSSLHVFALHPPDCDGNGVADACDPDCNHNLIPDACDLAGGDLSDCDLNGEPDVCQTSPSYLLPDGGQTIAYGPGQNGGDFIWLNRFTVVKGREFITHISAPWTGYVPDGHPITLMLYDDPNNDGNPNDAALLTSISVTGFDDFGLQAPGIPTVYAVPPTHVGEFGDSFFVAGFSTCSFGVFPATAYNGPGGGQSWGAVGPIGTIDLSDLSTLTFPPTPTIKYMLRAYTLDCNGNGIWDQCDIDSGFSLDTNLDGLPDECNAQCSEGDLNRSGSVDVDDLLSVINNWGPCDAAPGKCAGDATGNGVVDVDDLLSVLNNWGLCV